MSKKVSRNATLWFETLQTTINSLPTEDGYKTFNLNQFQKFLDDIQVVNQPLKTSKTARNQYSAQQNIDIIGLSRNLENVESKYCQEKKMFFLFFVNKLKTFFSIEQMMI